MATYAAAQQLLFWLQNLNMGNSPKIVSGPENEEVTSDQGPMEYAIQVGPAVLDVAYTIDRLNGMSYEEKIKFLASQCGKASHSVEEVVSNLNKMKRLRYDIFKEWFEKGRPETHIFR